MESELISFGGYLLACLLCFSIGWLVRGWRRDGVERAYPLQYRPMEIPAQGGSGMPEYKYCPRCGCPILDTNKHPGGIRRK